MKNTARRILGNFTSFFPRKTASFTHTVKGSIPGGEVEKRLLPRLKTQAGRSRIRGFRKGRAPLEVIREHYAPVFKQEIVEELIRDRVQEEIQSKGLRPAETPQVESMEESRRGEIHFTVRFELFPRVDVADFKLSGLEKLVANIEEADVDWVLTGLLLQHAQWKEAAGAPRADDKLVLSYRGQCEDETCFEAREAPFIVGRGRLPCRLEEALLGMRPGDTHNGECLLEAADAGEVFAGRKARVTLELKSVHRPELPRLDAEFFKKLPGVEDERELRQRIREDIGEQARRQSRSDIKQQVFDEIDKKYKTLKLPPNFIKGEVEKQMERTKAAAGEKKTEFTPSQHQILVRSEEKKLRLGMVFSALRERFSITIEPARLHAAIEEKARNISPSDHKKLVEWYYSNRNALHSVEAELQEEEIIDRLLAEAAPAEKQVKYRDLLYYSRS